MDREGRWFVDGEAIEHVRTQHVLTRNLRLLDDGSFVSSIGREVAPVRVDDVAFFVRDCDLGADLRVVLSDDSEERSADPQLRMAADGRLYLAVKDGRTWARFQRGPHQYLAALWDEAEGRIGLHIGGRFVTVAMS